VNTMSEKYTIVQHEKRLFWLQDCPVLLHSYALTKNNTNNSIFLQCKFENIADTAIKAMNIAVKCSDVSHQELANVDNFPYLDINVQPYTLFGDKTPVALPNNTTRNVRIIPLKVIFSDDTTWENTSERAYELAEYEQQPISSLGELADQYKRDLHKICTDSEKHNYLPANVNGFTVCGCGKVVLPDTQYCASCGIDFSKLFAINNSEILHTEQQQYDEEQQKIALQEQQDKLQKETQQLQYRKKLRKIISIISCIVLVIIIGTVAGTTYSRYRQEQEAIRQEQEALEKTQAAVEQITNVESDDAQISSDIEDKVITFTISGAGINVQDMPKTLSGFPKQDLESIWNDSSQLDNAIDSWLGLKDSYINLQSIIIDKYIELGGSDAYSIHTVCNSDDNIKIFEFDGNTLTYDYWEEIEEYQNNRLKLLADLSEILQYTLKYGWHSGSSQLYP
jgi:type II secretory pathway pseudopilin PulG